MYLEIIISEACNFCGCVLYLIWVIYIYTMWELCSHTSRCLSSSWPWTFPSLPSQQQTNASRSGVPAGSLRVAPHVWWGDCVCFALLTWNRQRGESSRVACDPAAESLRCCRRWHSLSVCLHITQPTSCFTSSWRSFTEEFHQTEKTHTSSCNHCHVLLRGQRSQGC